MADMEQVAIFKVGTSESIKNIGDLKDNIRELQRTLNGYTETVDGVTVSVEGLEIGTQEYQDTLQELQVNQAALRNAMNGTSASMDDVVKAAKGVGTTYNSLVAQMKLMKQEIRNVDVSTDEGKQKFAELAMQIDSVNDQLKAMDADMGQYQRNVGNYTSAFDNFGEVIGGLPPFLGQVKNAGENVHKSMQLLSTNPVMGTFMMLAPLLMKIASGLKESTSFTDAMKRAMDALKPVTDMVGALFERLGNMLGKVVDWFIDLGKRAAPVLGSIVSGAVGVGNAMLQYLLTPIRSAVEAFKGLGNVVKDVFTGQWGKIKEDVGSTIDGIKDAFTKGFSFKSNFQQGRDAGKAFLDGLAAEGGRAKKTGEGVGKAAAEGIKVALEDELEMADDVLDDFLERTERAAEARQKQFQDAAAAADRLTKKRLAYNQMADADEKTKAANAYEIQRRANEDRLALLEQYIADAEALEDWEGQADAYRQYEDLKTEMALNAYNERKRITDQETADAKAAAEKRLEIMQSTASAVSGLLGTIAGMYEDDADANEESAKKAKALRISEAVINTISGALAAYTSAQKLGPPMGPIVGAINASAVTAAGLAQIAKIKSTKVGSGDSSGAGVSIPATVSAPSQGASIPEVRNVTTAREEDRYERMAAANKVYILNSDLEANADYHKTQLAEATY